MYADPNIRSLVAGVRLLVFDFDGVFTDNAVWTMQDGTEIVRSSRGDGMGLSLLRRSIPQLSIVVLSTEENPVVTARCRKLNLRAIQGVADKGRRLAELAAETDLLPLNVAYVGNDVNDADCLRWAGLPIVVADAHPDVLSLALYRTSRTGGQGAVREVCDLFVSYHIGSF